ncbi:MAG: hypothetical protein PHH48_07830 [Eubacteriales bacterium]|nr:hypothetical protein [Eubacteriales bacterium]
MSERKSKTKKRFTIFNEDGSLNPQKYEDFKRRLLIERKDASPILTM